MKINSLFKKICLIVLLLIGSIVFTRIARYDDYYLNETNSASYSDNTYTCYQTYNLLPGSYNLKFSYEAETDFQANLVSIDTAEVIVSKTILSSKNTEAIDFVIDSNSKGVKLVTVSDTDNIKFLDASYSSLSAVYTDRFFLLGIIYLLLIGFYYLYKKKDKGLLIACGIAVFVSLPLISDNLPFGHDLYFHIDRIFNTGMQISKGNIIPRVNETTMWTLGSITPMMYPELMIYIPGLMSYLGVSVMLGYKLLIITINFLTSIICLKTSTKVFNDKIALIFTFLYMFNPYRLNEIFVRAALGELLGMAFIPLAFYGLYLLIQSDYKKGFFVASISITLIFQSHILSTYIFLIFGLMYALFYLFLNFKSFFVDKKRIIYILSAALLTIFINAFFLIPFFRYYDAGFWISSEYNYLAADSGDLYRLFANVYNVENSKYGMPISVGNGVLVGLFLTAYMLIVKKEFKYKNVCIYTLIVGLFAVLLSSPFFPWGHVQSIKILDTLAGIFQFPWRFQMISALFFSISIGISLSALSEKEKNLGFIVIVLCLLSGLNTMNGYININPLLMESKSDDYKQSENLDYYRRNDNTKITSKIIQNRVFNCDSEASFEYTQKDGNHVISFDNVLEETNVQIPVYYYENLYNVSVNGIDTEYKCSEMDTVELTLDGSTETGEIIISIDKKQFYLGDAISGVSIIVMIGLYVFYKKEEKLISSK